MQKLQRFLFLLLTLVLFNACTEGDFFESSEDPTDPVVEQPTNVKTEDIEFSAQVTIQNNELSVKVSIESGGTDIKLTGGDALYLNVGGDDVLIERKKHYYFCIPSFTLCSYINYEATVPMSDVFSTDVQVKLVRPVSADALNNFITLPEAVEFITPSQGESYSRAQDDINITWSNPQVGGWVRVEVKGYYAPETGAYFHYFELPVDDEGEYTIPAGSIEPYKYTVDPEILGLEKNVAVMVMRNKYGTTDEKFLSGSIYVERFSSVEVLSTP